MTEASAFAALGCRPIINASGKMTALGASIVSDEVADALRAGSQDYVDVDELLERSGEVIARATGAEDGCPTTGAAAGIVLSVAAVLTRGSTSLVEAVPQLQGRVPTEIVLQQGHAVHFGASITQMVRLGGGTPVEVGSANLVRREHIEEAIGPDTAALLHVKSHHAVHKGMQSLETMLEIAHEHELPLLVDAAAEEDLRRYGTSGADLVMLSGAKAIEGPTSGLVCGRADLVAAVRAQYRGVGRPMKVGKEAVLGLCAALEAYDRRRPTGDAQRTAMQALCDGLADLPGLACTVVQDEAGRAIFRARIAVNPAVAGLDAAGLAQRLREGTPAIHARDHHAAAGSIAIDPRPLKPGDAEVVQRRVVEIAREARGAESTGGARA